MRRYAVVGTGARAEMYVRALCTTHADVGTVVAWCDDNPTRMAHYDDLVRDLRPGMPLPARYRSDRFGALLDEARPDAVVVTSPDWTHARYVTEALGRGCDVVVEKPLTTSVEGARSVAEAAAVSTGRLVVTFNYRYSPRNSAVKRLLLEGAVGDVTSVHFEWLLDTVHGADYFRRWHREKQLSGGLLVHKASHHFDLVNWWLDDVPEVVFAQAGLRFYGDVNARAHALTDADREPFVLDLAGDPRLRRLYLDARKDDGYVRDRDVFSAGISIEDNHSVVVGYRGGASLSYSLTAHTPWEGYRVAVNGTEGRLELDVVERAYTPRAGDVVDPTAANDGVGGRLRVQRLWEHAHDVTVPEGAGAHGGGDALLLDDVFNGPGDDPLGRPANHLDGLRSVAVGLAANASIASGEAVRVKELVAV